MLAYESRIRAQNPDLHFDPERLLDITDFDYRFLFRKRLPLWLQHRLEIIAAKLEWKKRDGTPGYFRNLVENGIGWKSEAAVIASVLGGWADKILRCGIWTKGHGGPRNSGRCHQHAFCRLCSWLDFGKLLRDSLGIESDAFPRAAHRSLHFFAITLSVRDHDENARASARVAEDADFDLRNQSEGFYSEVYKSRPVSLDVADLGNDQSGIQTCRLVMLACQKALRNLYRRGLLTGVKSKVETALLLMPTDALPHVHAVATAKSEIDAQYIADELKAEMNAVLFKYRPEMQLPLWASVRVYQVTCADHLERAALYLEKVIPVGLLVQNALARPEAKNADGTWNRRHLKLLDDALNNLPEQVEWLTSGFQAFDSEFHSLQQRLSLGNLRFGKHFIGTEPDWHREYRLKKADEQREKRRLKRTQLPKTKRAHHRASTK